MSPSDELKRQIKAYAGSLGFGRVGVSPAARFEREEAALDAWLQEGRAGSMAYMEKDWRKRARPGELLSGACSVIALAMSYYNGQPPALSEGEGRLARYAWGRDYHKLIEKRLDSLVRYIEALAPEARCKTLVDTGPLLERAAAQKAGLGFIGKNTMLITRGLGSYVFLASIVTTLELPADGADERTCGTCTLCIDACPTQAITEPYRLDARRCIAYLTIESQDPVPQDIEPRMGDWLFGCDICQEVCPHNTRVPLTPVTEFHPASGAGPSLNLLDVMTIRNEAEFNTRFAGTPLKRAKRTGLQRSARRLIDSNKSCIS